MTGIRSSCAGCLEIFNGVEAFDAHRNGAGAYRRCLNPIEMRRAGFTRGEGDRWDGPTRAFLTLQTRSRKPAIPKDGLGGMNAS